MQDICAQPVQPVRPSYAPPKRGAAEAALASILQRAKILASGIVGNNWQSHKGAGTASHGDAKVAPSGAASPDVPTSVGETIQRKRNHLPSLELVEEGVIDNSEHGYNGIVLLMDRYLHDGETPETDYGRRRLVLEELKVAIEKWEGDKSSDDPPANAPANPKLTDEIREKRRNIVKTLKESMPSEEALVRDEGFDQWKRDNTADREALKRIHGEAAKSNDRILRNSAEWIMKRKAHLFAVTPTGDSELRLSKANMDPKKDRAFTPHPTELGTGSVYSDPVEYNKNDLADNSNVGLIENGKAFRGWNSPRVVAIVGAAREPEERALETIRHEVQHDADWHDGRDASAGVHKAGQEFDASGADLLRNAGQFYAGGPATAMDEGSKALRTAIAEQALKQYKTEFRAYSYQEGSKVDGNYGKLDNSVANKTRDGQQFTERQLAIFNHIYRDYEHTKTNWDADPPLTNGRTFRAAVAEYRNPDNEAFNKYNSARVDDFYRALDAIGFKEAPTKLWPLTHYRDQAPVRSGEEIDDANYYVVAELLKVVQKLAPEDATYIVTESPAMLKKMAKHLKGEALGAVKNALQEVIAPSMLGHLTSIFDDAG